MKKRGIAKMRPLFFIPGRATFLAILVTRRPVEPIFRKYGMKNRVFGHFRGHTCYQTACVAIIPQVWHYHCTAGGKSLPLHTEKS
jgi:hypothetical protein